MIVRHGRSRMGLTRNTAVGAMAVTFAALFACAVAGAAPEDWPRWLGPRGDGISREKDLAEQWPRGGPKQLWTKKVGGGYASPIAAGGKLYVFSSDAAKEIGRAHV